MKNVRSYAIIDYLKEKRYCSIPELREKFKVSNATIHRDIAALVQRGVVQKVRGGVALGVRTREEPGPGSFMERLNWNRRAKQTIADAALRHIHEGDILFLDSSSTVCQLAEKLPDSTFASLTIVTNAVSIIRKFHSFPLHYVLIGLGGGYDPQLNSFLGQSTIRELEQLSISKAFVSAFGLCDDRVTTNHEKHFTLLMTLMNVAEQKFLLLDRSKLDRKGLFRFATKNMFDAVITD
ncbi:MAG: DeoR/GlpR family DNA-binding transcription regulator [Lentisphaeria bacterium]|nr:DeoR/GlpR family DNA-binding transcription regulator [Lentisphaeria bacterium]